MKVSDYKQLAARLAVLLTVVIASPSSFDVHAQNSKTASLISEIKAELPGRQKEISEKCGGASVIMEVDFASFGDNYDALLKVSQQGLKETTNGFRRFCTNSNRTSEEDPDKVKAVKTKVKKIVIKHVPKPEQKKVSLQDGGTVLIEMVFGQSGGGLSLVEIQRMLGEVL